jgi:hypothetical protein
MGRPYLSPLSIGQFTLTGLSGGECRVREIASVYAHEASDTKLLSPLDGKP